MSAGFIREKADLVDGGPPSIPDATRGAHPSRRCIPSADGVWLHMVDQGCGAPATCESKPRCGKYTMSRKRCCPCARTVHTHTHHEADRSELDQKPRKTWQLCVEDVFDFHLPERQVNHRLKHQNSGGLRHFDLMVPRPLVMKDNSNMFSH